MSNPIKELIVANITDKAFDAALAKASDEVQKALALSDNETAAFERDVRRMVEPKTTLSFEGDNLQLQLYALAAAEAAKKPEIPNRVCAYEGSEYYWPCKGLGVRFNGVERKGDVVEFDVAEGWVRVHQRDGRGRFKQERGQWSTITLKGTVEPYWKD